jgi:hypothetical protein
LVLLEADRVLLFKNNILYTCVHSGYIDTVEGIAEEITIKTAEDIRRELEQYDEEELESFTISPEATEYTLQLKKKMLDAGAEIEAYNVWYSTPSQFAMKIRNPLEEDLRTIVVKYHNGDCNNPTDAIKVMDVTVLGDIHPSDTKVLRWSVPKGIKLSEKSCMTVWEAY